MTLISACVKARRRLWAVALLPWAVLLTVGPGFTLYVHACRIRGTEVRLEPTTACCAKGSAETTELPTLHRTACCEEHVAQLGADLSYSASTAPAVPNLSLVWVAVEPAPRIYSSVEHRTIAFGRAPPPPAAQPSGRERRIAFASFLI